MKTEDITNQDLVKIIDAFTALMAFEGLCDVALINKFEKSHMLYDEDYEVIDCNYNSSLIDFCASLRVDVDPKLVSDKAA